jgi:hypothetical protein
MFNDHLHCKDCGADIHINLSPVGSKSYFCKKCRLINWAREGRVDIFNRMISILEHGTEEETTLVIQYITKELIDIVEKQLNIDSSKLDILKRALYDGKS